MAFNTARSFIEDLQRNTALATQFYTVSPNSLDGVVDFATGKGYVFSKDELAEALKDYPESKIAQQLRQYMH